MNSGPLFSAAVAAFMAVLSVPAAAQTVIVPDPPPASKTDSAKPPPPPATPAPPDTARPAYTPSGITPAPNPPPRAAAAAPAPAPAPPPPAAAADPLPRGICADAAPGESAPDVLAIVFEAGVSPAARDSAIASVSGKRLEGTAENEVQYVAVPAGGSEFRLRALADKLIRRRGVNEVGPVTCPAQAMPTPKPDSSSS
ncbi:MAG TPA: hypothetical protein VHJ69_03805 [Gemmatimonadales bacterium]|jgi:hypothetical protein|nr:hypothetical protein [Gemmatimonadales bacterium]